MLDTIFNDIANKLDLGVVVSPVEKLTGGFAHEVFKMETNKGKYAIKLLNQETMAHDYMKDILTTSEKIEQVLQDNSIPIVPSIIFNGTKMQEINNRHFYVYDWVDGKALATQEVQKRHCEVMGKVLAQIHNIKHDAVAFERYEIMIDWDSYIQIAKEQNHDLALLLSENRDILYRSQEDSNFAYQTVSNTVVISNGDMDSKNVLWDSVGNPHIIDLEYLSFTNPYVEAFQLALCWSGFEHFSLDYDLFKAFIDAYVHNFAPINEDIEVLYKSNAGSRLEWLEANIRKTLMLDGDNAEEANRGFNHAKEALKHTVYYHQIKGELINYLQSITKD